MATSMVTRRADTAKLSVIHYSIYHPTSRRNLNRRAKIFSAGSIDHLPPHLSHCHIFSHPSLNRSISLNRPLFPACAMIKALWNGRHSPSLRPDESAADNSVELHFCRAIHLDISRPWLFQNPAANRSRTQVRPRPDVAGTNVGRGVLFWGSPCGATANSLACPNRSCSRRRGGSSPPRRRTLTSRSRFTLTAARAVVTRRFRGSQNARASRFARSRRRCLNWKPADSFRSTTAAASTSPTSTR